jgi:hypothetical protein
MTGGGLTARRTVATVSDTVMRRFLLHRTSMVTLIAWLAAALGPALIPHHEALDFACADEAWASRHPTTQVEPVHATVDDAHCVVCHLQRALRDVFAERARSLAVCHAALVVQTMAPQRALVPNAIDVPARAPPTVSL